MARTRSSAQSSPTGLAGPISPPRRGRRNPQGTRRTQGADTPLPTVEDSTNTSTSARAMEAAAAPTTSRSLSVHQDDSRSTSPHATEEPRYNLRRSATRSVSPNRMTTAMTRTARRQPRAPRGESSRNQSADKNTRGGNRKRLRESDEAQSDNQEEGQPKGKRSRKVGPEPRARGRPSSQKAPLQPIMEQLSSPAKAQEKGEETGILPLSEASGIAQIPALPPSRVSPANTSARFSIYPEHVLSAASAQASPFTTPARASTVNTPRDSLLYMDATSTLSHLADAESTPYVPTSFSAPQPVRTPAPASNGNQNSEVAGDVSVSDELTSLFQESPRPKPSKKASPISQLPLPSYPEAGSTNQLTTQLQPTTNSFKSARAKASFKTPAKAASRSRRSLLRKSRISPSGYESFEEDEDASPDYKPGDPRWREKKRRIRLAVKIMKTGELPKNPEDEENTKRKPGSKPSAPRQSMITLPSYVLVFPENAYKPRMKLTDRPTIDALRAVAERVTSDENNKLPSAEQLVNMLEQAKSRGSAAATSPSRPGDAETHPVEPTSPKTFTTPTARSSHTSKSDSDASDEVMSDLDEHAGNAQPGYASTVQNAIPQTPVRTSSQATQESQGWFHSARKAVGSTLKFFAGAKIYEEPHATNSKPTEFTFTSPQKLPPGVATPSHHGGRSSSKRPQTERPARSRKMPPERKTPRSERRKKIPIEQRDVIPPERIAEARRQREEMKRKQHEAEAARIAEEEHARIRTFRVPSPSQSDDDSSMFVAVAESSKSQNVDSSTANRPGLTPTVEEENTEGTGEEPSSDPQCKQPDEIILPHKPDRDEDDDFYYFDYKDKRYSRIHHRDHGRIPVYGYFYRKHGYYYGGVPPPVLHESYFEKDPAYPSPQKELLTEWFLDYQTYKKLCEKVRKREATREEIEDFNQRMKDKEITAKELAVHRLADEELASCTKQASTQMSLEGAAAQSPLAQTDTNTEASAQKLSEGVAAQSPVAQTETKSNISSKGQDSSVNMSSQEHDPSVLQNKTNTQTPPPPPRPSNAQLPAPSGLDAAVAKANKYAPKNPSKLHNAATVEDVENVPEERGPTNFNVNPETYNVVERMNEWLPRLSLPQPRETDVIASDKNIRAVEVMSIAFLGY